MKKVTKAVIPAAGLGTRVLPATKAMPKEMLPIVDKPAIQYHGGGGRAPPASTEILIITWAATRASWKTTSTAAPSWRKNWPLPGKEKMLEDVPWHCRHGQHLLCLRQKQTNGLGPRHPAVAKAFTGDDPFVVLYGDDVIVGRRPGLRPADAALTKSYGKALRGHQARCPGADMRQATPA